MGIRFSRSEILKRLGKTTKEGKPIVAVGVAAGIIAKCAELGGADLVIVFSTGLSRIKGLRTAPVPESNRVTLRMYQEIADVVKDTPIIAGIEATEFPTGRDLAELVKEFTDAGFSGIINCPTVGRYDDEELLHLMSQVQDSELAKDIEDQLVRESLQYRLKKAAGLDFKREIEMIRLCRSVDIFTMSYVFTSEQARKMAAAGTDCLVAQAGSTGGGITGFGTRSHREAAEKLQKMFEAAKTVNPNIICLGKGGPFAEPEDTKHLYEYTDAIGFVGASSFERIPVEKAVKGTVQEFKSIPICLGR